MSNASSGNSFLGFTWSMLIGNPFDCSRPQHRQTLPYRAIARPRSSSHSGVNRNPSEAIRKQAATSLALFMPIFSAKRRLFDLRRSAFTRALGIVGASDSQRWRLLDPPPELGCFAFGASKLLSESACWRGAQSRYPLAKRTTSSFYLSFPVVLARLQAGPPSPRFRRTRRRLRRSVSDSERPMQAHCFRAEYDQKRRRPLSAVLWSCHSVSR